MIKELRPLPAGYKGTIKIGETKSLVQENVVVLSHVDHEQLVLYGQKLLTNYEPKKNCCRSALTSSIAKAPGAVKKYLSEMLREESQNSSTAVKTTIWEEGQITPVGIEN